MQSQPDRMSFLVEDPTLRLFGKTIPLNQSSLIPDPPPISHLSASPNSSHRQVLVVATSYPKENSADEEDDDDREASRREFSPDRHEVSPSQQNPEPTTSSGVSDNSRTSSVERETSVDRETSALKPSTYGEQSETEGKTLKKPDKLLPCPRCNSTRTKFCYYNNYNVNQPRHFCKNCQRYWTAGGTMRSVLVGAGRRKNKNSSVLPYRQIIMPMSAANRTLETAYASNGSVFKPQDYMQNCFTEPSGDDQSSRSSITGSNSSEKASNTGNQEQMVKKFKPFPPQIPTLSHLQWGVHFQPPFCSSSGFPVSYYPIPLWGCTLPSSWILPSSSANSAVLMSRTLRIDDLNDAEKSSINGGKLFNAFQSKRDEQSHVQASPLLQANPAALSMSIKFHERS